ncbi:MAG: hypothetical protein CSB33_04145 [Desulfobacterales bacterium]|nr:MAG: hypothetical protein CSB33_04145 [Desulfobacterales bacterium]
MKSRCTMTIKKYSLVTSLFFQENISSSEFLRTFQALFHMIFRRDKRSVIAVLVHEAGIQDRGWIWVYMISMYTPGTHKKTEMGTAGDFIEQTRR